MRSPMRPPRVWRRPGQRRETRRKDEGRRLAFNRPRQRRRPVTAPLSVGEAGRRIGEVWRLGISFGVSPSRLRNSTLLSRRGWVCANEAGPRPSRRVSKQKDCDGDRRGASRVAVARSTVAKCWLERQTAQANPSIRRTPRGVAPSARRTRRVFESRLLASFWPSRSRIRS